MICDGLRRSLKQFNVDLEIIWTVVEDDLPELKRNIETILKEIEFDE